MDIVNEQVSASYILLDVPQFWLENQKVLYCSVQQNNLKSNNS